MSYAPTEWKTGDTITAEKLNNMEDGIVGSAKVLFSSFDEETGVLNRTWNEIKNAMADGVLCLVVYTDDIGTNISVFTYAIRLEAGYCLFANFEPAQGGTPIAVAEAPDDYPVTDQ